MRKNKGPTAANTVRKNMPILFSFAAKKLGYNGPNPVRHAERMKTVRTVSTNGRMTR